MKLMKIKVFRDVNIDVSVDVANKVRMPLPMHMMQERFRKCSVLRGHIWKQLDENSET